METTLTEALEREHDDIDEGLAAFAAGLEAGTFREDELSRAARALRRHIYLEEEFLFPPLRAAGMLAPVLVMLKEHGEIWRTLDALEEEAARLVLDLHGGESAALAVLHGQGAVLGAGGDDGHQHAALSDGGDESLVEVCDLADVDTNVQRAGVDVDQHG